MPNRGNNRRGASGGILATAKAKVVALTALLTAVAGLAAAFRGVFDLLPFGPEPRTAEGIQECLVAVVEHPEGAVNLSEWLDTEFVLTGENRCGRELNTHVAFKPLNPTVRVESPAGCPERDLSNPDCWAEHTLEPGPLGVGITPPKLTIMVDRLEEETSVSINWILYANDGIKVRTGENAVRLRDDRALPVAGRLGMPSR